MKSLETTRNSIHAQFLNIRNCYNIVNSDDFEIAYRSATITERTIIHEAVIRGDKQKIKFFINERLLKLTPFEKLGLRRLRGIGQHLRIQEYQNMSKIELIEEIKNVIKRLKNNSKRVNIQSEQSTIKLQNFVGCRKS